MEAEHNHLNHTDVGSASTTRFSTPKYRKKRSYSGRYKRQFGTGCVTFLGATPESECRGIVEGHLNCRKSRPRVVRYRSS